MAGSVRDIQMRELKCIPAKGKVIEYYSVNYGRPKCRKEAVLPQIKMGTDAHDPWMASASTVAWIIQLGSVKNYVSSVENSSFLVRIRI